MFYALYYLFGYKIDDIGNSNDLYNTKVKDYFDINSEGQYPQLNPSSKNKESEIPSQDANVEEIEVKSPIVPIFSTQTAKATSSQNN